MAEIKTTGLKKRQQIESAGKAMFMWVAAASVAVSFCLAAGQFLYKQWSFNNNVYSKKIQANRTLSENIVNAKELQKEVDALTGNQDLASVKATPDDNSSKIVLDALPGKYDPAALATSLQQAILSRSGVAIESISVPTDEAIAAGAGTEVSPTAEPIPQEVSVVVSGNYDKIITLLKDFERTIRPMKLNSIAIAGSDNLMRVTIELTTYYQPSKTVNIKKEAVR